MQNLVQNSDEWFAARKGRITASNVAALLGLVPWTPADEAYKRFIGTSSGCVSNVACDWGTKHEPTALAAYSRLYGQTPTLSGLHLHEEMQWLAASPDALVGTDGCVEIKCPFWRRRNQSRAEPHPGVPLYYYIQMTAIMACCKRKWCDFVSWTPHTMHVTRVHFDPTLLSSLCAALEPFLAAAQAGVQDIEETMLLTTEERHVLTQHVEESLCTHKEDTHVHALCTQTELIHSDTNYRITDGGSHVVCTAFVQA